ncbi:tetratricopeptide repeat protein [Streptosporangium sp. NPDC023615]|uniref:tetratricopeptide repeat protein n=1 Tax=Streptosporangium sp. NPDC023615 TaxID=3154794 RepID=UPI0034168E08
MADNAEWDRRSLLRGAAAAAGAAMTVPLLGGTATAQAGSGDADALFRAGRFEQAARAYERILRKDPGNVDAARQRGYAALLVNRFPDAERYLKAAVELAPDDKKAHRLLADCYTRQDRFSLAAPHWKAAGEESQAELFAAFRGEPYRIRGDVARVPWRQMDPMPTVQASLNGGPPKDLSFYTRVASLNLSARAAKEAGLRAVTEERFEYQGRTVTYSSGILDSFELGGIELRNIPVSWSDTDDTSESGDGLIGTWILYHFLTTVDYAGRSLILRRRTPETADRARAAAERSGAEALPLWLAREHLLFSRGSIAGRADSGERVVALNIGGGGEMVASTTEETARRLRIRVDRDRPMETSAGGRFITAHPCYPKEVRLGGAVADDVYCYVDDALDREGFDVLANFSHGFYKPYNITLDFTGMNVYIARGRAT